MFAQMVRRNHTGPNHARRSHLDKGCQAMCEVLEARQLLSTVPAPTQPAVSITAVQGARETLDPSKGNGIFLIKRTGPKSAPLDVTYSVGGSATPGEDYTGLTAPTGVVTIPAGKSSVQVRVHAVLDTVQDPAETIIVTLTGTGDSALQINPKQTAATIHIQNVFAINAQAAFGTFPLSYTATLHPTYRQISQPKSTITADAAFPLDLTNLSTPTGPNVVMAGTWQNTGNWQTDGLHLDTMTIQREGSWQSRTAEMQGVLFIPAIVGPSWTQTVPAQLSVFGALPADQRISGTVQVTSQATGQTRIKVPAGTFTATKLVVTSTITGHGNVTVQALSTFNHLITRRVPVTLTETFTWTYYLVPGTGVVKADLTGSFNQTTEYQVTLHNTYVLTQVPPSPELAVNTAPLTA